MVKIGDALLHERQPGAGAFSWAVCNELRHFYSGRDEQKSFFFCEAILRNSVMDSYILNILSGWAKEPHQRSENLLRSAGKYPQYQNLAAACTLNAAEFSASPSARRSLLEKVVRLNGPGLEAYRAIARTILQANADRSSDTGSN